MTPVNLILGSQSPQRLELLQTIVPADQIRVAPPANSNEAGFDDCHSSSQIHSRLEQIAEQKNSQVRNQVNISENEIVLTADTVIIVSGANGSHVLGKPDGPDWQATVRDWFYKHYSGQTHQVTSAVCLARKDSILDRFTVTTQVTFHSVSPQLLDWYIQSGEPLGKAGGYGIQSAGSLFVKAVEGSLSNVIGLPLEILFEELRMLEVVK